MRLLLLRINPKEKGAYTKKTLKKILKKPILDGCDNAKYVIGEETHHKLPSDKSEEYNLKIKPNAYVHSASTFIIEG
jgi:hypothetical protein